MKRFVSKWIPGDYLVGSGGPPVIVTKERVEEDENDDEEEDHPKDVAGENENMHDHDGGDETQKEKEKEEERTVYELVASINDNFTDNPMYPFTIAEASTVTIALYQADRRWNMTRLTTTDQVATNNTTTAYTVPVTLFQSRLDRLAEVMHYPIAIAFLLVRLSGMKIRCTEYRLKKTITTSDSVIFANATSLTIDLPPGRFVIIPYTHITLDRAMEYVLHLQYIKGQLELEIDDPILQRLQDREPSEDGILEETANEPEDNDLLDVDPETEEVSILSYEKIPMQLSQSFKDSQKSNNTAAATKGNDSEDEGTSSQSLHRPVVQHMVPLPKLLRYKPWEYREDLEESSLQYLFEEVGDMMNFLKNIRSEVRKLHTTGE